VTSPGRTPIPVTVLGGYLGAGKTTLVNQVLRNAGGIRFAVLVNDFGAVNIDADLIESADGDTIELSNGCICCSVAAGFAEAMFALRERTVPPDRVIVEASGVADPAATAQYAHLDGFELDAVVVLADAETIRRHARDRYVGRHVVDQLRSADLIVLNKVDLVDEPRLAAVRAWIAETSVGGRIVEAVHARVPLASVIRGGAGAKVTATPLPDDEPTLASAHEQWSFTCEGPIDAARFRDAVVRLPESVVRGKGIVTLADDPAFRHVFQLVGRRWSLRRGALWGDSPPTTKLAFIGTSAPSVGAALERHFDFLRTRDHVVKESLT